MPDGGILNIVKVMHLMCSMTTVVLVVNVVVCCKVIFKETADRLFSLIG